MNKKKYQEMKDRGERLLTHIEKLPNYEKESALFDIEYAVAKERYEARKKTKRLTYR